jgi:hypothetical protein
MVMAKKMFLCVYVSFCFGYSSEGRGEYMNVILCEKGPAEETAETVVERFLRAYYDDTSNEMSQKIISKDCAIGESWIF